MTAVTAVVLTILYFKVYARRSALLQMQQACLTYSRAPGTVVYEDQPGRAPELLQAGGEYISVPVGDSGPPPAGHVPALWHTMRRWAMPDAPPAKDAVLFFHERQTPAGNRGLVCVEADRAGRALRVTFIHPGASTLDPTVVRVDLGPRPQEGMLYLNPGDDPFEARLPAKDAPGARADLRFFEGLPDPKDATHFVLPYESAGRRGEIELWLEDDKTAHYINRLYAVK